MPADRIEVRVGRELRSLMPRFLANRRTDLEELESALRQRDGDTLRRIGHQLKGAGSGYGFPDITRIGGDIETGAKQGDYDRLALCIAELKLYLESVHVVFE
jgi:histidine phosphotransfer protein HptB